jgi:hypothetical protein
LSFEENWTRYEKPGSASEGVDLIFVAGQKSPPSRGLKLLRVTLKNAWSVERWVNGKRDQFQSLALVEIPIELSKVAAHGRARSCASRADKVCDPDFSFQIPVSNWMAILVNKRKIGDCAESLKRDCGSRFGSFPGLVHEKNCYRGGYKRQHRKPFALWSAF